MAKTDKKRQAAVKPIQRPGHFDEIVKESIGADRMTSRYLRRWQRPQESEPGSIGFLSFTYCSPVSISSFLATQTARKHSLLTILRRKRRGTEHFYRLAVEISSLDNRSVDDDDDSSTINLR
jgi:hypothetical protein